MERWLNQMIQNLANRHTDVEVLNPFGSRGHVPAAQRTRRKEFRNPEAEQKLSDVVNAVEEVLRRDR